MKIELPKDINLYHVSEFALEHDCVIERTGSNAYKLTPRKTKQPGKVVQLKPKTPVNANPFQPQPPAA